MAEIFVGGTRERDAIIDDKCATMPARLEARRESAWRKHEFKMAILRPFRRILRIPRRFLAYFREFAVALYVARNRARNILRPTWDDVRAMEVKTGWAAAKAAEERLATARAEWSLNQIASRYWDEERESLEQRIVELESWIDFAKLRNLAVPDFTAAKPRTEE